MEQQVAEVTVAVNAQAGKAESADSVLAKIARAVRSYRDRTWISMASLSSNMARAGAANDSTVSCRRCGAAALAPTLWMRAKKRPTCRSRLGDSSCRLRPRTLGNSAK